MQTADKEHVSPGEAGNTAGNPGNQSEDNKVPQQNKQAQPLLDKDDLKEIRLTEEEVEEVLGPDVKDGTSEESSGTEERLFEGSK